MQLIERFSIMVGIYKGIEGWYLAYTKLLLKNIGDKHLLNEFEKTNINAEMSWDTFYNKMVLVK